MGLSQSQSESKISESLQRLILLYLALPARHPSVFDLILVRVRISVLGRTPALQSRSCVMAFPPLLPLLILIQEEAHALHYFSSFLKCTIVPNHT